MQFPQMLAPCGLDCGPCDIRRAKGDPDLMRSILEWFKNKRNLELKPEDIRCNGCRGDRTVHWSGDCVILRCCVDQRKHQFCSQCQDFPCAQIQEWVGNLKHHQEALDLLKKMSEEDRSRN